MTESLELVIASDDVKFLASVLRGEIDAEDIDLTDINGITIGLQPALFDPEIEEGEVLIEARTLRHHLMGWCDGTLARQMADSLDGTSDVEVPVTLFYRTSSAPDSERFEVAVSFVPELPLLPRS